MTDKKKDDNSLKLVEEIKDIAVQTEIKKNNPDWISKAETLCEALPYMRRFAGETFVIKFGGSAMGDPRNIRNFAEDVVLLKQIGINPIVVHGGGPQIGEMLKNLNIKTSFVDGLRVTDEETVNIVEMVLCGSINKNIVKQINEVGGMAVGLSGKDGNLIKARKLSKTKIDPESNIEKILNLGYVGEPYEINPEILNSFDDTDIIPVIAPIGFGENGETFNINADTVAGALAGALQASKLIILSDVDGVMLPNKELVSHLNAITAKKLIHDKVITGGMIPKVETCIKALQNDTECAHILNGSVDHILLMELFTESGAGTMIFY
ncbi:MAG: acetylglutamate kinase [Proteobacteria bacterium]|nr:acetylglutamate kinase [Pseudomonadota bacterium]